MPKKFFDPTIHAQIHHGRRKKLRDLYLNSGLQTFNEQQVLEYALGLVIPRMDTNPTAHLLINKFGSLVAVLNAHPNKLMEISGIGEQASIFLNFLSQFVTYYQKCSARENNAITTPAHAIAYLARVMQTYSTEQFVLLCLDKKGNILLEQTITTNHADKVELNFREIADVVLRVKSSAILFAHNHIDTGATPSDADVMVTRALVNVFTPLDVDIMDHIIFGADGGHYSFASAKVLDIFKREHRSYTQCKDFEDVWVASDSDQ